MKTRIHRLPYKLDMALAIFMFFPLAVPGDAHVIAVPSPTGPRKVGTASMRIVDARRNDPYVATGIKRELLLRLWYPASVVQNYHLADYASPKVWRYISQLTGVDLPPIRTNSFLNAPVDFGPHPVVLLTHGYTGTLTDYTFLAEDLASRGYVVVSVAHTYESTAVELPDGRLVQSMLGSHFRLDALRTDEQTISFAAHVRVQDLSFVLDELQRLNSSATLLTGRLDLHHIAVMGHSLGGIAALAALARDPRLEAAVVMDAPATAGLVMGSDKPVLILAAGRDEWGSRDCQLWRNLRGPRLLADFRGAEHLTASDAVWLAKDFPQLEAQTGSMGAEKTMAAMRNYIAAFLNYVLLGGSKSSLLTSPSADYPDIALTNEKQALCGELVRRQLQSAK